MSVSLFLPLSLIDGSAASIALQPTHNVCHACPQVANTSEIRFYGKTSESSRVVHFSSRHIKLVQSMKVRWGGLTATAEELIATGKFAALAGHNASFPPSTPVSGYAASIWSDALGGLSGFGITTSNGQGDNYVSWRTLKDQWSCQWPVDSRSSAASCAYNTLHQIWARAAPTVYAGPRMAAGDRACDDVSARYVPLLSAIDYSVSTSIALPFAFRWFGRDYGNNSNGGVWLGSNGYIAFGTGDEGVTVSSENPAPAALHLGLANRLLAYAGLSAVVSDGDLQYVLLLVRYLSKSAPARELQYTITFGVGSNSQFIEVRSGAGNDLSDPAVGAGVWQLSDGYGFVDAKPPAVDGGGSFVLQSSDLTGTTWGAFPGTHLDIKQTPPPPHPPSPPSPRERHIDLFCHVCGSPPESLHHKCTHRLGSNLYGMSLLIHFKMSFD